MLGNVKARCPYCNEWITFNDIYEVIRCPLCRSFFHPEFAKEMSRV